MVRLVCNIKHLPYANCWAAVAVTLATSVVTEIALATAAAAVAITLEAVAAVVAYVAKPAATKASAESFTEIVIRSSSFSGYKCNKQKQNNAASNLLELHVECNCKLVM